MQQQADTISADSSGAPRDAQHDKLQRRGNVEKCPVCGSRVEADAYHCPTCRSYFCFHCRARLLPPDTQLQCVNQQCDYYGKLVCGECNELAEKEEPPAVYAEPEDGYWPAWLALILPLAAVIWYFTSFLVAAGFAIAAMAGGGYLLQRMGWNVFGRERRVEHRRTSTYYTCISCHQPVKELRRT